MCDLSIVIVSWNTRELLAGCLGSVEGCRLKVADAEEPPPMLETFVVDNASTDGSAEMVRERFPWVRLIESHENLGFAGGNNLALRQTTGGHILLLNPDTVVEQGAIERLRQTLIAYPAAGIAGAQLLNADGSLQMSCGRFPSLWTEIPLVNRLARGMRVTDAKTGVLLPVQQVDWVSGACLMIKRGVYEAIGPLDESFWLYTEETDWCYRARQAGWEALLVPDARVLHLARAASGQRFVFTMLLFYQSRVRFINKHHGSVQADLVRRILRTKAAVWRRRPRKSPLHAAYPHLADEQIIPAYQTLEQVMALPVARLLSTGWQ